MQNNTIKDYSELDLSNSFIFSKVMQDDLEYLREQKPNGEFSRALDRSVANARHNALWRKEYMTLQQEILNARYEALEEGREEREALKAENEALRKELEALKSENKTNHKGNE